MADRFENGFGGLVAVVTGGGTGMGRELVRQLTAQGCDVATCDVIAENLAETVAICTADGNSGKILSHIADVSNEAQVLGFRDAVAAWRPHVNVLFNNAGIGAPPINLEDLTYEQWKAAVDTNLTGPFLCTQHAFRIMKNQTPRGGRIINNGSISAHAPRPNSAPYTSTKHAITGLTKATSLDGRKYDIACGQIDIGNAHTPMTGRMLNGVPQPDGSIRPEPVMDVDNVGKTILFMASLPLDANVQFVTVMATKMPFIGRG